MASDAYVIVVDGHPDDTLWAERRLRDLEHRWSRFIPTSDISRINRSGGGTITVHNDTIVLIESMQHAANLTAGSYDPTMLCEIVGAGYGRSIEDPRQVSVTIDRPSLDCAVTDIGVNRVDASCYVPNGLGLDPGGIGKGLASDLVVSELLARGAAGALVSVGGDMAFAGVSAFGDDWNVSIADPFDDDREVSLIGVSSGGVATSSTLSRRWRKAGQEQHHMIDPRSRRPSSTDLAAVTVVAAAGWQAEALATAAILATSAGVVDYLDSHRVSGIAVALDGHVMYVGDVTAATSPSEASV